MLIASNYADIQIFDPKTHAVIGRIDDGLAPRGLFVDTDGTLYAADSYANQVSAYPIGAQTPSAIYSGTGQDVYDVAKCKDGTLYAAAFGASVAVYANGSTTPTWYITDSDASGYSAVACDPASNVFVAYNSISSGKGMVKEYPPLGKGHGKLLPMQGGSFSILTVDSEDDVVFLEANQDITFWKPGRKSPYRTISTFDQQYTSVTALRFAREERRLWVYADISNNFSAFEIDARSGKILNTVPTRGSEFGMAVYPSDAF
jgi:hypothetical protein